MKKLFLLLALSLTTLIGFSQGTKSIIMNDPILQEYFEDYVEEASDRGLDVQQELLEKIDYILIVPEDVKVNELAETDSKIKIIKLSNSVRVDRLTLKVNLYRELSHVLGIPYNEGSIIMFRDREKWFSYAFADDIDIMQIEMTQILSQLK